MAQMALPKVRLKCAQLETRFVAVHESAYGTKRTFAALQQFVRYWTNNGQSSALARDASVATIEFF
jgi:hypothetical protein